MNIVTSEQLDDLLTSGRTVVVNFTATWCQPCKAMAPTIDALRDSLTGVAEVVKLNIDDDQEAAAKHGVRGVPTFMVFRHGRQVAAKIGAQQRQPLIDWAMEHAA